MELGHSIILMDYVNTESILPFILIGKRILYSKGKLS